MGKIRTTSGSGSTGSSSPEIGKRSRRNLDDALKTKIVLEALKETEPLSVLASRYEVHPWPVAQTVSGECTDSIFR